MQMAGTEWTTGVGDDTTEVRVFFHKGTVIQSVNNLLIGGPTSGKDIMLPSRSAAISKRLSTILFETTNPGWLVAVCQLWPKTLSLCAVVPLGKTLSSAGSWLKFPHIPLTLFSRFGPILTSKVLWPSNWTTKSVALTTMYLPCLTT